VFKGQSEMALVGIWKRTESKYECKTQYYVRDPVFMDPKKNYGEELP